MATRQEKFRQAAWGYFIYGVLYWFGGLYLQLSGLGPRGRWPGRFEWLILAGLFLVGALFVVVFPWLISRGARGAGYLWFVRILALLVGYRAFEVGRIALRGGPPSNMPEMIHAGAWAFFLITLAAMALLSRAAWSRRE